MYVQPLLEPRLTSTGISLFTQVLPALIEGGEPRGWGHGLEGGAAEWGTSAASFGAKTNLDRHLLIHTGTARLIKGKGRLEGGAMG